MEKQLTFLAARLSSMSSESQAESKSRSKKPTENVSWKVYTDGAARGNPGKAGAGIYVTQNDTPVIQRAVFLGKKTNNQAEYLALALALYFIKNKATREKKLPTLIIQSDSELLVKQIHGIYKIKNSVLAQLKQIIDALLEPFSYRFSHVRREHNIQADALANKGIDDKIAMPIRFANLLKGIQL